MIVDGALDSPELRATRTAFGDEMLKLAKEDPRVVACCADLSESVSLTKFKQEYAERYFEFGVAEQNMVAAAAGMSLAGLVPFVATFGAFVPFRTLDQIRINLGYAKCNVKLCSTHCGLLTGEDGATHQPLEDVAALRAIPGMTIIVPADALMAAKAVRAVKDIPGPCYIRLSRAKTPVIYTTDTPFEIGKAIVLREPKDVVIVAMGSMVHPSLVAARDLEKEGIVAGVIDCHTVKPLDIPALVGAARTANAVVVVEEHQVTGGLGGAVSEALSEHYPCVVLRVGVNDSFGESGKGEDLLKKYGLTSTKIKEACHSAVKRKLREF